MRNIHKMDVIQFDEIVRIAKILFDTKGFDHTTIHDITSLAGMSEGIFSLHFNSTDEVLEAIWSGQ